MEDMKSINPLSKIAAAIQNRKGDIKTYIYWLKQRALLVFAVFGAFVIAIVLFLIIKEHQKKYFPGKARKAGNPIPISIYHINRKPITEIIGAVGEVRPFSDVIIASFLQAEVKKVHVDVGDFVKKGQILIELDQSLIRPDLISAQNRVKNTKVELEKLKKIKPTQHQELLSALESSQAQLRAAKSNLEKNQTDFNRIESLYEEGIVSKSDFDAAKTKLDQALQVHSKANENLIKCQNALDNEEAIFNSTMTRAQYNYSSALQSLAQAQYNIDHSLIKSPVDGIITERNTNPGEIIYRRIQEARPLLTVAQIDPVLVATFVPQEQINSVLLNQKARVTMDSEPNKEFEGTVVKITPVINPDTKTFTTMIKVDNPQQRLKPGMSAFVRIHNEHFCVAVPKLAVIDGAGETTVFVIDENQIAHLKKIKIGKSDDKYFQVISGLRINDVVAIAGQINLKDGDKVRILGR